MIEKMCYVNIMGHIDDFDRVVEKYVSKYDIQLEYAFKELAHTKGVFSFSSTNPYINHLKKAEKIINKIGLKLDIYFDVSKEEALETLDRVSKYYESKDYEINYMEEKHKNIKTYLKQLEYFKSLEFNIDKLAHFEFIKYHFGRMPVGSYKQFETFLYSSTNMLFVKSQEEDGYIYGMYFVTTNFKNEAVTLLSTFHFEQIWIPYSLEGQDVQGTPLEIYENCLKRLEDLEIELKDIYYKKMTDEDKEIAQSQFVSAFYKIRDLHFYYETKKYAARTKRDFYIFIGWMSETEAFRLEKELENDTNVVFNIEDGMEHSSDKPPTKINNPVIFRPFEFFVKMYGLPSYDEIDPTIFVALTYTFFFGFMFGDVGQGALLSILGFCLYKFKKMSIGSVIGIIGLSSMFFGFMYGSIFGFEHIIHGFWIRPIENLNYMLLVSVCLGVTLILISMIFNIYNDIKQKKWSNVALSPNGIAGVLFYSSIIYTGVMLATGSVKAMPFFTVIAVISLLFIAFRIPITKKLQGKEKIVNGNVVLYLFELFIELFEIMLSYFTNTISFVRIGAFALSHAGIMDVVMMLAKTDAEGVNPIVVVIGNIIVICLEGLVVGIQSLRLDFYEMFSRFYKGNGREFIPYNSTKNKY